LTWISEVMQYSGRMFWDVVRHCEMLCDVLRWCEMLWDVVRCCGMLWDVVRCCGMLWDVVGCCGMLWDVVRCCLMLFDVVWWCLMVPKQPKKARSMEHVITSWFSQSQPSRYWRAHSCRTRAGGDGLGLMSLGLMGFNQHLVGGLEHGFYFSIYWEFHNPNRLSYFSERLKPPTSYGLQPTSIVGIELFHG